MVSLRACWTASWTERPRAASQVVRLPSMCVSMPCEESEHVCFRGACVLWPPRARSCCSPLFNKPNQHNVCPRRRCSLETHVDHGARCKLTPHTACLSASRRAERAQDAIVRLCVVRGAWCVVQESILQHAKHVIACGPPESGTKMVPTSISLAQLVPDLHRELS